MTSSAACPLHDCVFVGIVVDDTNEERDVARADMLNHLRQQHGINADIAVDLLDEIESELMKGIVDEWLKDIGLDADVQYWGKHVWASFTRDDPNETGRGALLTLVFTASPQRAAPWEVHGGMAAMIEDEGWFAKTPAHFPHRLHIWRA